MGLDGAGAQAGLDFAVSDVNGQNAQALLEAQPDGSGETAGRPG